MDNKKINDQYIKDYFLDENNHIKSGLVLRLLNWPKNVNHLIVDYIVNRYNDSDSIKESLYRIIYDIEEIPICPVCGSKIKFIGKKGIIYRSHCSVKCSSLDKNVQNKLKCTCLKKYGVENYSQTNEYKEKSKKTCLKKYNTEYSWQSENNKEKSKITCLRKYGEENYKNKEKAKLTSKEKYGTEYPFQSNIVKEKIRNTCLAKYGVPICNQFNNFDSYIKYLGTCQEKYGVMYVNQFTTKELRNQYKYNCKQKYGVDHIFSSDEVRDRIKDTFLLKYGVDHPMKCKEVRDRIKDTFLLKYGVDHPMKCHYICNKSINTRIIKGTWSTSKLEEDLYVYIKEKFSDVKRQYIDKERYPWHCDFYIPELDYFIELNGMWTHGKHPFDCNSTEDISILETWKEKYNGGEHPMYLKAIEGWTKIDVKKRETAKKNNINYKEVWTLEEGKKFINALHYENKKQ